VEVFSAGWSLFGHADVMHDVRRERREDVVYRMSESLSWNEMDVSVQVLFPSHRTVAPWVVVHRLLRRISPKDRNSPMSLETVEKSSPVAGDWCRN
jgi:hypothetical protein